MSGEIGKLGERSGAAITDLTHRAQALQSKFKKIEPGTGGSAVEKIAKEAKAILAEASALSSSVDEKHMEHLLAVQALCTPIVESANVIRLASQEQKIRTALLAQTMVFKKSPFDERQLESLIPLCGQLDEMLDRVYLMDPKDPLVTDLRRQLIADRTVVAQLSRDAEKKRYQEIERRECEKQKADPAYKPRLEFDAFTEGAGENVVSWLSSDADIWTRDVKAGPQMKTEETKCCEEIVHALLTDESSVTITEKQEGGRSQFYVSFPRKTIDHGQEKTEIVEYKLDELMNSADFSQIQLGDEDFERYAQYDFSAFKPDADEARLLRQINDPKCEPRLSAVEKKALLDLPLTQKRAINLYTRGGAFSVINQFLRGRPARVFSAMSWHFKQERLSIDKERAGLKMEEQKIQSKRKELEARQDKSLSKETKIRDAEGDLQHSQSDLELKQERLHAIEERSGAIKAQGHGGDRDGGLKDEEAALEAEEAKVMIEVTELIIKIERMPKAIANAKAELEPLSKTCS